jgi:arylsulfatase A-like enzyme
MGLHSADVTKLVVTSFWPYIVCAQAKILTVYLVVGALIGLSADLVSKSFRVRFSVAGPLWIESVTAYFLLAGIRAHPQFYSSVLYDRNGLLRRIQVMITHTLPGWCIVACGSILLLIFCGALLRAVSRRHTAGVIIGVLIGALVLGRGVITARLLVKSHSHAASVIPNIVLITVDSLRNDAIEKTRHIKNLARDGVIFHQHYTSLPCAFPALASLLTGKLPVTHGIRTMYPSQGDRNHVLGSLPDILRRRGYVTTVVSDGVGDVFSRFAVGFDTVKAPHADYITLINERSLQTHFFLLPFLTNPLGRLVFPELQECPASGEPVLVADESISSISGAGNTPFFMTIFFSSLHEPYAMGDPYYRSHSSAVYQGRFKYDMRAVLSNSDTITPDDIRQIRGLYYGALDAVDDAVGNIIDYLKRKKIYDKTLIIITADHGENLYENDWYIGHSQHLRGNQVLNIPLIIKFPKSVRPGSVTNTPKSITAVTRDIDIMPTLLDYLGIPGQPGIDGASLMTLINGTKTDLHLTAFSETGAWLSGSDNSFYQKQRIMYPDLACLLQVDFTGNLEIIVKDHYRGLINTAKHRMVDDGRYRLIYVPTRQGIMYELYDRQTDPAFTRNIAALVPEKTQELKKKLFEYMAKDATVVFKNGFAVYRQ